jgi:hypothetical protein
MIEYDDYDPFPIKAYQPRKARHMASKWERIKINKIV